jgi:NAD(P)-dependent dehydrogenase (short-subunit alcohol dehydrogenase family)
VKLQDSIVLITGANRGIGLAFAQAAFARGAHKVYAGAGDPALITTPGLIPVRLGGGAFLNVLSAASWINSGAMTADAFSKAAAFDALAAGASKVLADERARTVKRGLTTEPPIYL